MTLIRNHISSILSFWIFSVVVQLAFMHSSSLWPQNALAWFLTIIWPLVFLAVWLVAPILARKKASEGDQIRIGFIVKVGILAVPVVVISAVILSKIEVFIKPHFVP